MNVSDIFVCLYMCTFSKPKPGNRYYTTLHALWLELFDERSQHFDVTKKPLGRNACDILNLNFKVIMQCIFCRYKCDSFQFGP